MARRRQIYFEEPPKEEEEKKNEVSYLQPEILPLHMMLDVLKARISKLSIEPSERDMVIALFYKHISPKPQRDYRDNRRGKILKKQRQRREKQHEDEGWKKMVVESKGKPKSSALYSSSPSVLSSSLASDRLKPPPSAIDPNRKKISIGASKQSSNSLDFVIIKRHSAGSDSSDQNKKAKIDIHSNNNKRKGSECVEEVKRLKTENSVINLSPQSVSSRARDSKGSREHRSEKSSKNWHERHEDREPEKKKKSKKLKKKKKRLKEKERYRHSGRREKKMKKKKKHKRDD